MAIAASPTVMAVSAMAQQAEPPAEAAAQADSEIIVTAQKRNERLTDVPLSVTAISGDQLAKQGVTSANDLERVVPGFAYQPSPYGTPVFSIRGLGFYENSLGVSPAVTVYVDQVPLPFLVMTAGASFDLERVEALKGPQGTLFGQNSTGGAINYIAAKPTNDFRTGLQASYGRFNQFDLEGFVSGPLTDTLSARVAVRSEQRDDWQRSYTRDDSLGQRNFLTGRFLLNWEPSTVTKFQLSVSGWRDKSDTQAAQFRRYAPGVPNGRPEQAAVLPTYPVAPFDIRSADWDAGADLSRDDRFYQLALRADFKVADFATLTSITAYSDYRPETPSDIDGTNFQDFYVTKSGYLRSFSQELRLAGDAGGLKWLLGTNVQLDKTFEDQIAFSLGSNQRVGPRTFYGFSDINRQGIDTYGVFANLEYPVLDTLTLQLAGRYTDQQRDFDGCLRDVNGTLAAVFSVISGRTIPAGTCVTLGRNGPGLVKDDLNEDNFSWKASANWKPNSDLLIYANITKGYKSGSFGTLPAISSAQFTPVTQESVLAYEGGIKASLANRRITASGAVFYYDYSKKQILGFVDTGPPFGKLPGLVNVPKSSVLGAEAEITARTRDIRLSLGVTYVHSNIDKSFQTPDPFSRLVDVKGEAFPNTPKWQVVADAEYTLPTSGSLHFFIGGGAKYRSASYAALGLSPEFRLSGYTLVDLRGGIENPDAGWRLQLWGRNIFNKRYVTNVTHVLDTVDELTGMPATYGITASYKLR